ncbi:DUF2283 domain-containing protein [Dehalococcoidia bacterium]|nr:DUF2283 domain-containing protein [Dehalococcoidia bacterium]
MRIEYDPVRDLLYMYFASSDAKAAETMTVAPGVHADFGRNGKLLGIEIIDASQIIGKEIEFGLPETANLVPKVEATGGK